ncbi:MAG: BTAD domain-containing putative transcriptional regulator [Deltaproteobacteria bacterium]
MSEQILLTKMSRPAPSKVLLRERLFRRLDLELTHRLVWVSGPAGCGKSTLMSSYLENRGDSHLWYRLDEGDADIATFFYYLGMAAGKKQAKDCQLPLLTPEYCLGIKTFTRRYFEDLYSILPRPFILVFDNFEEIPKESPFNNLLQLALSCLPDGITAVVIGRQQPPAALARLAASQSLEVLGWDDLRFTPEESKELLESREEWQLTVETIRSICRHTQGWAAGLILLAESVKKERIGQLSAELIPTEEIFNYFANEILTATAEEIRNFLLITALLPEMTPRVAEKLTDQPAAKILTWLHRDHFFLDRHRSPETVYSYHPLFRKFLLAKAEERFPPAMLKDVRKRAAALLEEGGEADCAAVLFLHAKALDEFADLLNRQAPDLLAQGRHQTIVKWIRSLSDDHEQQPPILLYWLGMAMQPSDPVRARKKFERVFHCCSLNDPLKFLSWAAIVDGFRYEWNDFTPLAHWIDWLDDTLRQGTSFPSTQAEMQVVASMAAALMISRPDHPEIHHWAERAVALARGYQSIDYRVHAYSYLVNYYFWMGDFQTGGVLLEEIRQFAKLPGASPLTRLIWNWLEAGIDIWLEASYDSADRKITEALKCAEQTGVYIWNPMLWAMGGYSALVRGDVEQARRCIEQMAATLDPNRRHMLCQFHYLEGWCALVKGEKEKARMHTEISLRLARETSYVFPEILALLGMVWVAFGSDDPEEGRQYLAEAEGLSLRTKSRIFQYACLLARAHLGFMTGDEPSALKILEEGLRLGRICCYYDPPWSTPPFIVHLCAEALQHGIEEEHAREIIRRRRLVLSEPPVHIDQWPWPVKVYTLGSCRILIDEAPLSFSRKAQKKPLEMLIALIALGGREVPEDQIADALWPDADGDAAHKSFATTLHRLRQMLGEKNAIQLQKGQLSIDGRYCWVDALVFQEQLEHLLEKAQNRPTEGLDGREMEVLERMLGLYQGNFLADDNEKPWFSFSREKLRKAYLAGADILTKKLEKDGKIDEAIAWYEKTLVIEPSAEQFYLRVMLGLSRQGRAAEAIKIYNRCRKVLKQEFDIEPAAELRQAYQTIIAARRTS